MSFDLLIIGSGVVGSALAIKTSQLGYKVAIIDSRETFPNSYRHLSVNQKSKAFLNGIGVWKKIENFHLSLAPNCCIILEDISAPFANELLTSILLIIPCK